MALDDFQAFLKQREAVSLDYVRGQGESVKPAATSFSFVARVAHGGNHAALKRVQWRGRRAGRREYDQPGRDVQLRKARFGHRRHVRQKRTCSLRQLKARTAAPIRVTLGR